MRRLVTTAVLLTMVACGGGEGGTNPPPPAPVATVTLSQADTTLEIGQTLSLGAVTKDASGTALNGRAISWASSDPGVATVTAGVVTAVAVGNATISATSEGKRGDATIRVKPPAVATVILSPSASSVKVTETKQLTVTLKDVSGNTLTGRDVTWSSSDEARATVSPQGLVTGLVAGSLTITATSEGKSGAATILVTSGEPPVIASISPATLTRAITATITGQNFSPIASEDIVTIAGVPVTVTSASSTQLTVAIDQQFPCLSSQSVPVVVTTIGGPTMLMHPLEVATQRNLAVGGSLILNSATESGCNELAQTGGQYMVMLYNASESPTSVASFQLRGNTPTPGISPVATPLATMNTMSTGRIRLPALPATDMKASASSHLAMLQSDRDLVHRLGMPQRRSLARSRLSNAPGAMSSAMAPVPTTVGATTTVRIRAANSCSTYDEIGARVAFVSNRTIVLEDTLSPLAKTLDSDYATLAQQFDDVMYPLLLQNFGDPLAADATTDVNGRIIMLVTPKVNQRGQGLLGFVSICDFFPQNLVPASNVAEIFYARAPLHNNASQYDIDALTFWRANMRSTVMHESKHIVAYAERIMAPYEAELEESWLEEGTAQVASEIYSRTIYGSNVAWKSNATYASSVYCDIRTLISGPCFGAPYIMANHFVWLYQYLQRNETTSFLSPGSQDGTIYGSAWLFARWLTDQYASNEGDFLKALTKDGRIGFQGVANVTDKVRRPFQELNANYLMALELDDYPGLPSNARYTIPSWDLPSIFNGFATDLTGFRAPPQIRHLVSFGSFTTSVQALNGTAGAYFAISGAQAAKQLLDLRSRSGAAFPASSTLRMAIVRTQ